VPHLGTGFGDRRRAAQGTIVSCRGNKIGYLLAFSKAL
jgi:hypothetical protein